MRNKRRVRLAEPIKTAFVAGNSEGKGLVEDVSLGGFFVRSPLLPPEGTPIEAALTTLSGCSVSVRGVVRWNTATLTTELDTCGFGVRITRPSGGYVGIVDGALAAASFIEDAG